MWHFPDPFCIDRCKSFVFHRQIWHRGRYADVVVHRLLAAALGLNRLPEDARDREKLAALADNINVRHRNAQMAGRASVELHTLIFFKDRSVIADARITKVLPQYQGCHQAELPIAT